MLEFVKCGMAAQRQRLLQLPDFGEAPFASDGQDVKDRYDFVKSVQLVEGPTGSSKPMTF